MADYSGQTLGKYQLTEKLGRGGMAEVYKAYQPSLDRFVAVKMILDSMVDDEEFVTRFQREAQIVAQLRHNHILQVIDFDAEDDMYYMVMEYIQGGNLKEYIEHNGKLEIEQALHITEQMADALDYAHNAGMIHRDIKPANIMFMDKTYTHAVLTDFGIARMMNASVLTSSGMMIGTPVYMSPEAAQGMKADARADIYGMGVVLYEMLTGAVPFSADTPFAIIMKQVNEPLPPVSRHGIELPPGVEAVLMRATMKDPDERYATAAEFRDALKRAREDLASKAPTARSPQQPVKTTATPQKTERVPEKPKRSPALVPEAAQITTTQATMSNRAVWGLAAAILILAVVMGGLLFALASGQEDDNDNDDDAIVAVASEPFNAVDVDNGDETLPDNRDDDANQQTDNAAPPAPPPTNVNPPPANDQQRPAANNGVLPISPRARAEARSLYEEANEAWLAGDPQRAEDLLTEAIEIVPEPLFREVRSYILTELGDLEGALADIEAAIAIDPTRPNFLEQRASLAEQMGDFRTAQNTYTRLLELQPDDAEIYAALGNVQANTGQARAAVENYRTALELAPNRADFLTGLGFALLESGNNSRAAEAFDRAVEIAPDDPFVYLARADAFIRIEEFELAEAEAEQALELDADFAAAYDLLGSMAFMQDDYEDAAESYERALELDPNMLHVYVELANTYGELDRDADAIRILERGLELFPEDEWLQEVLASFE